RRTPRDGRAVVAWLDAHGADLCTQASARMVDGQKVVLENGDALEADTVCLSAGAWSSDLLLHSPSRNWVRPIKGQMLAYAPGESSPDTILRLGPHYLIPRKDGRILVGSTLEDVGYDTTPTAEGREVLKSAAVRMWPALRERAVEHHWSGLRPLSVSQQPLIGLHQPSGVWINAGHYRNGVTLAAGSAELLAASIMGDQIPVWAEDFKPPDCLA
ncbi:FAD-dependent oxidoreductase, partial [bacterium]|nr:FAD-dependent oxidoreductase [bacterium]